MAERKQLIDPQEVAHSGAGEPIYNHASVKRKLSNRPWPVDVTYPLVEEVRLRERYRVVMRQLDSIQWSLVRRKNGHSSLTVSTSDRYVFLQASQPIRLPSFRQFLVRRTNGQERKAD